MSTCIKDLFDYDLFKKCSKCGIVKLKSNFHKTLKSRDGLDNQCRLCWKHYYVDNKNRLLNKQKFYNKEDRDRIKEYKLKNHDKIIAQKRIYSNNKYKTDINFCLIYKTRCRIRQPLNGKIKSSSTIDILGIDINTYKRWIEFQMTPDMTWDNIEFDHVKAFCLFDLSKDEELKEAFSWKITQPLLKHNHQQKGIKFNLLDYQLQIIKAYQFIKLNEGRFN